MNSPHILFKLAVPQHISPLYKLIVFAYAGANHVCFTPYLELFFLVLSFILFLVQKYAVDAQ